MMADDLRKRIHAMSLRTEKRGRREVITHYGHVTRAGNDPPFSHVKGRNFDIDVTRMSDEQVEAIVVIMEWLTRMNRRMGAEGVRDDFRKLMDCAEDV